MTWFYANGDAQEGPVSGESMAALLRDGTIGPGTLVWRHGMAEWEPAERHMDAFGTEAPAGAGLGIPASGSRSSAGAGVHGAPAEGWEGHGGARTPGRDYRRESDPMDAARKFFANYATFSGRSNRGEYWFWVLDSLIVSAAAYLIGGDTLQSLWGLATFIPTLALNVRRLHDIGRSGWWLLIWLIPLIGWVILIWWATQPPDQGPNKYG